MKKYSRIVELNPILRRLVPLVGVDWAVGGTVTLIHTLLAGGLAAFGLTNGLSFYTGARTLWLWMQLASLRIERELDKLREGVVTPPAAPSSEDSNDPRK